MTEEEEKKIIREKHPGRVIQGHKLAALMKKKKYCIAKNILFSPSVKLNDTYVYGVGILAVLAISVCVFFEYNTFQPKKSHQ